MEDEWNVLIGNCIGPKNENLKLAVANFAEYQHGTPKLLEHLTQTKAEKTYVQLVRNSIQAANLTSKHSDYCCYAPLEALESLAFVQDISVESFQWMLGMLAGRPCSTFGMPKEAHAMYTATFWEAPENVL